MSSSFFRAPGEDFPGSSRSAADAVFTRNRGGVPRPAKAKVSEAPPENPPAEPAPEPPAKERGKISLSNPILKPLGPQFGDKATASVDFAAEDEDISRRVLMELFARAPDGERQRLQGIDRNVAKDGKAKAEFTLYQPNFRDSSGELLASCEYVLVASHPDAKPVESPPVRAEMGTIKPFEGAVFYSPSREEYLIFADEAEAQPFLDEVRRMDGLRKRAAAAIGIPDPSRRMEEQESIAKEAEELFGEENRDRAKKSLEELLLLKDHSKKGIFKGWSYLPDPTGEGKKPWKYGMQRFKRKDAQLEYDRLLKRGRPAKTSSPLEKKLKSHLIKGEPKSNELWEIRTPADKDGSDTETFTWSGEAALLRYLAGWDGVDAAFDPKKKTLKFGTSGQATGSLFEGKLTGAFDLPGPQGINILEWVKGVKFGDIYLMDASRVCLLKARLQGQLSHFLGGTIQGALTFPSLCFDGQAEGKQKAEASGSGSVFVGARAEARADVSVQWSRLAGAPFQPLGSIGYVFGASLGAGAEANIQVDYSDGKFTFRFSAAAAWGLGAKGGFSWTVDAMEGGQLIGHLLDCVDWHFVKEISEEAYEALTAYTTMMQLSEEQRVRGQMEWYRAKNEWVGRKFGAIRKWLLEKETEFILAKISITKEAGSRSTLAAMCPEALGLALAVLMKTREETDFDIIMLILGSTVWRKGGSGTKVSPDHKLKWVLRYITDAPKFKGPEEEKMKEESLRAGLKKLKDFGNGHGYETVPKPNDKFLQQLQFFLKQNGLSLP